MQESEILFQVSQIVSTANSFAGAVDQIRSLFEQALGAQALTIDLPGSAPSQEPRLRSPDPAALRSGGRELGKLFIQAEAPYRVSNYVGEQLGMLLERTRLGEDRERLKSELAAMRNHLATRKAVQRARGILVTRRGMSLASAQLWISQQARLSRLSVKQLAEQVIAEDNAQRENLSFRSEWRQRRIA
jgi:hypothetical protein